MPRAPVSQIRDSLTAQLMTILHAYRKHCCESGCNKNQLVLPRGLKLLPLHMLALTKSPGLRDDARADERAAWLAKVATLPVHLAAPLVFPRMFAVHDLPRIDGAAAEGRPRLPAVVGLSKDKLEAKGVYLLENGEDAFLWVGGQVSPDVSVALFGARNLDQVAAGQLRLARRDSPLSQRLYDLVDEIRRQRGSHLRLRVVKSKDPLGEAAPVPLGS